MELPGRLCSLFYEFRFCSLDVKFADLLKKHSYIEAENINLEKQLDEVTNQRNTVQQAEQLLKQVSYL